MQKIHKKDVGVSLEDDKIPQELETSLREFINNHKRLSKHYYKVSLLNYFRTRDADTSQPT